MDWPWLNKLCNNECNPFIKQNYCIKLHISDYVFGFFLGTLNILGEEGKEVTMSPFDDESRWKGISFSQVSGEHTAPVYHIIISLRQYYCC